MLRGARSTNLDGMPRSRSLSDRSRAKEFFLRKAIGWALRQYVWTNPVEVARYVRENAKRLSPLSQREAMKNAKGGKVEAKSGPKNAPSHNSAEKAGVTSSLGRGAKQKIA